MVEILIEAGVPADLMALLHGPGGRIGAWLCDEPDIRFYAFTGSTDVGLRIQASAGLRRTQMELGSIAATILNHHADLDAAPPKVLRAGYRQAGQVCTSIPRLHLPAHLYPTPRARRAAAEKALKKRH